MKPPRLIVPAALLCSACINTMQAQTRPQLVVGIVIDGLDHERLLELRDQFVSGGFNRLMDKGVTISTLDYGSHLDEAAATAVIYTGAAPSVNGVASAVTFDQQSRLALPTLLDSSTIGNYTDETFSPKSIRVSTLADELRIDTGGLGQVYALSPDASQAIIMAGHAGNNAAWINDNTGRWATTTYYRDLPSPITTVNRTRPLAARLDTMSWTPLLPPERFTSLPSYKRIYGFRNSFPHTDTQRYRAFKSSALANDELTNLSIDYIKSLTLGQREPTDMLSINYTLQPYMYAREADTRAEMYDSYVRLDRQLDKLFRAIDADGPGMSRTMVFVVGTPAYNAGKRDDERWQVPTGEFSPARALSLLKVNLMSIFGNGDWVIGYNDRQIYLNRQLIKDRGLSLDDFRRESADFLRRMSGVNAAATIDEVVTARVDGVFPPARNIDIETAGDVFLAIAPGWSITDGGANSGNFVVRAADSTSAAFILYPNVKPTTIDTPVDARAIAPTIARTLHIRSPNGASVSPLRL